MAEISASYKSVMVGMYLINASYLFGHCAREGCPQSTAFDLSLTSGILQMSDLLYHPPTFHMDSIWNEYIPWIPHGFHMEYVSPYKSNSYYYGFHVESMSIPYGIHINSTQIPHGIHVEHTYTS